MCSEAVGHASPVSTAGVFRTAARRSGAHDTWIQVTAVRARS